MGGRALLKYGVTTERKSTKEFNDIFNKIKNILTNDFSFIETHQVKCYHNKTDHGDLDVLIKVNNEFNLKCPNVKKYIEDTFKPNAIYVNSGVYSFDYDNFQIDFILIGESRWESAKVYYSYDPLGNLMGKTFHKFGLSYGWDGLSYKYRNFNGVNTKNINISRDTRKIFEFGRFDYDRYLEGFDNLNEILEYVINSKYFDSEMFRFENLKHKDRKRNRKRGSYHVFLKYISDNNINVKYDFNSDKKLYLPMINDFFPESKIIYKLCELNEVDRKNKIIASKFNGNLVMGWLPDLMGKELGQVISNFKKYIGVDYSDFIYNSDFNTIRSRFFEFYDGNEQ